MNSIETLEKTNSVLVLSQSETVSVSIAEYQNLIACRVILDMLLDAINADGVKFDLSEMAAIFRAAIAIRGLYL